MIDTSMSSSTSHTVKSLDFEEEKGEWSAAELWLEDRINKQVADGKFLLGVFTVGPSGQMQLQNEVTIWYDADIISMLQKYCKRKGLSYFAHNWLYASADVKDFPEKEDTPKSLGWTNGGCAVISCILGEDFRKHVFNKAPRPVTHGKMSRPRQHFVVGYAPYARASASATASGTAPVSKW